MRKVYTQALRELFVAGLAHASPEFEAVRKHEPLVGVPGERAFRRVVSPEVEQTDAIEALVAYLEAEFGVRTFIMQPSARNPRAVRAYEKVGFVRVPATAEEIAADWGRVDHADSVLMIREAGRAR